MKKSEIEPMATWRGKYRLMKWGKEGAEELTTRDIRLFEIKGNLVKHG